MKDMIFKMYKMCDKKTKEQFVSYMLDIVDDTVLSHLWHFLFELTDYNRLVRTNVHGGKDD